MPSLRPDTRRVVLPGRPWPLGATPRDGGVNFALYSQHAEEVFLLLYERPDGEPTDVIRLERVTRHIRHAFVAGVGPGQLYAYRVRGPYDPAHGLRFNEHKLLLDPYARELTGKCRTGDGRLLGWDERSPDRDFSFDARDSAPAMPRCLVVDDAFDWRGDAPPDLPFERLVIYEVHVKGFTAHSSSGVRHPGTYPGFVEKIPYLVDLGINAVELLPVHEHAVEDSVAARGLTNYWGYNTVGFFAPEWSYSTRSRPGCQVDEFKTLVRELHRAGIEVLLDVVYNHSAEGSELGPTLSFRGIDNPTYYVLEGDPQGPARRYANFTGCGNSLDLTQPPVIRLVMDSLRYWVETMHIDGFRFDLASVLGRVAGGFDRSASFFGAVSQDPVLSRVKLIAEPWDLGTYQVGNFPIDWGEWNGRYRDTMRRFARGDAGQLADVGCRLTGSADLYADDGRAAYHGVNFVTCHDGFTLRDLVSFDRKHNEANLEENRDGSDDNASWNCGVEGETDDGEVVRLRGRLARNHVCHLLFSLGTPMLLGGDEFLRTQGGNNNAYCQDNSISWFDWGRAGDDDFREFVRRAIAFRARHPILRRRRFLRGCDGDADGFADCTWFSPEGGPVRWDDPESRTLCWRLDGGEEPAETGEASAGRAAPPAPARYQLFLILNPDPRLQYVRVPGPPAGMSWRRVIDTSLPPGADFPAPGAEARLEPADHYLVNPRSTVVLIAREG
ncbi:MAG: glycogen debranching protein GlgX [Deltaproteobacteria bacterium]|nr:glycogen debranching protein GlgX [Deltaproteobacteria bacterium]